MTGGYAYLPTSMVEKIGNMAVSSISTSSQVSETYNGAWKVLSEIGKTRKPVIAQATTQLGVRLTSYPTFSVGERQINIYQTIDTDGGVIRVDARVNVETPDVITVSAYII